MMDEREALARVLYRMDWGHLRMDLEWPTNDELAAGCSIFDSPPTQAEFQEEFMETADAILAAGYRRQPEPREVTTVEELDALPRLTAILNRGRVWQKLGGMWSYYEWQCADGGFQRNSTDMAALNLPAAILFTPSTERGES